jgi:DNA-binding CsgD family transcriptional regulator
LAGEIKNCPTSQYLGCLAKLEREMNLLSALPSAATAPVHLPVAPDVQRGADDAGLWQAIGVASAAIGGERLYDCLLEILAVLVDADLVSLVRYSSFGTPDIVIPREVRDEVAGPYNAGLYAFDPFHHYWRTVGQPAVTSLHNLATSELWTSRYALDFMRAARISDEVAVFLPAIGGASPTLILDREHGRFSADELAIIERVFPLLAGLHHAHLKAIVSPGMIVHAEEKPLRLIDRSGQELAANRAWHALAADPSSGLSEALHTLACSGVNHTSLSDGRLLVRSRLPADFGAAPGGWCEQVETPSPTFADAPCDAWLAPLTQREREIVVLTLEGHPIASIAQRLGVSRGTIKNHRLRLYQKLDITTERELFLTHMQHLQQARR